MNYRVDLTPTAQEQLARIERSEPQRAKAVTKALRYLAANPQHAGLNSQKHRSLTASVGKPTWESYAENNRPGAYRIFWQYGPERSIAVLSIVPHP